MPQGLYAASSNSVKTITSPSGWAPLNAPAAPMPPAPPPTTTSLGAIDTPSRSDERSVRSCPAEASTIEHALRTLLRSVLMTAQKRSETEATVLEADEGGPGASGLHEIVSSIGPKLRELRLQRGMSLQQLAAQSDVSAAAIHKNEPGGPLPTFPPPLH